MQPEAGRRFQRYPITTPVKLHFGRKVIDVVTEDVSRSGMRLCTDAPPPEKVVVRVSVPLPPDGVPITLVGITAHVSPPGGNKVPGLGVLFYGNAKETLEKWGRYIDRLRLSQGTPPGSIPMAAPYQEPIRRRFERVEAVMQVRCRSLQDLEVVASRDVSRGGMFLITENPCAIGQDLGLEVVHPDTGALFPLAAVVRRVVKEGGVIGMGVEFLHLSESHRSEFWEFVRSGIPSIENEELEIVNINLEMDSLFDAAE